MHTTRTSTQLRRPLLAILCCSGAALHGQGVLEATLTSGKRVTELRYTDSGEVLRIEDPGDPSGALPPVNLLDLESGTLTIVYRHNSTFLEVPAERLAPAPGPRIGPRGSLPRMPELPPGIGPRPEAPPTEPARSGPPAGWPGVPAPPTPPVPGTPHRTATTGIPELPPGIGPRLDEHGRIVPTANDPFQQAGTAAMGGPGTGPHVPGMSGFPEVSGPGAGAGSPFAATGAPAMPEFPELPPEIRAMMGSPPGGGMPARPQPPTPPGMPGQANRSGLVETGETREIHGLSCTRYTLTDPRDGVFEIWATTDLYPFFLLEFEAPNPTRHSDLHESWPALLREKGLFPMLAVLRDESGERERLRFEVTRFETDRPPADAEGFAVPDRYRQSELRPVRTSRANSPTTLP